MINRKEFLMDKFSLLFRSKMLLKSKGENVDYEIKAIQNISNELDVLNYENECDERFFKIANFFLYAYVFLGVIVVIEIPFLIYRDLM